MAAILGIKTVSMLAVCGQYLIVNKSYNQWLNSPLCSTLPVFPYVKMLDNKVYNLKSMNT